MTVYIHNMYVIRNINQRDPSLSVYVTQTGSNLIKLCRTIYELGGNVVLSNE